MSFPIVKTTFYWADLLGGATNATLAAPLLLAAAKQGVGQAIIAPAFNTVLADLDEATFIGYSRSGTIVWTALTNELDGSKTAFAPSQLYRCTTAGSPQTINNGFVTDGVAAGGAGILGSFRISPPPVIANVGDGFSLLIGWNEGVATLNSEAVLAS